MSPKSRQLRCFAERRGRQWQAFCLDLNLAVQAGTLDEVEKKLHDMVKSYVELAMEQNDPSHQRDMLYRPAPASIQLRYWYIRLRVFLAQLFGSHNGDANQRRRSRRGFTFHDQAGYC